MDVTVLCDAVAVFPEPVDRALPGWTAEQQQWTEQNAPGNVTADGGWWLHFHSFLVTDDSTATLVDTGIGPAGSAAAEWLGTAGRLPELLAKAGLAAGEIDTVVLTHVHLDHAGWNADGASARFGNAAYVVQQAEVEHVRGTSTYERYLQPVADQLRVVDGETALGGIRLVPAPGHTPGHQVVVTERAVLAGDVLVHPAQAQWPELTYVYETDPAVAVASRREVFALAASYGVPVVPAHLHAGPEAGQAVCPAYRI